MKTGGVPGGRPIDTGDPFEVAISELFGDRMRESEYFCGEIWSAVTNTDWSHDQHGDEFGLSFRAAGDLIAAIRGGGDYLEWYCCAAPGVVSDEISEILASRGWRHKPIVV